MNGLKVVYLFVLEIGQFWIMWFTCNKIGLKNTYTNFMFNNKKPWFAVFKNNDFI